MICRSFLKKLASVKQSECHVVPHGDASRSTTRNYRRKIHGKSRTTASSLIFDQMIEHILRINRIHRQLQGHLKISGSGKTTFLRFVVWINGIPVFQLKVHSGYTGAHLDEDIRHVLCQACCKKKYIIFSHGIVASPTKLPGPLVSAADLSKNQEMITANKNHMDTQSIASGDSARFRLFLHQSRQ
uniref:Dynein heavy chain AAA module D4 domain-containing protein n=1 Tax=Panagrolaimus sp. ES5 TaxID=591445 RepID=A0AC34GAY5_9BILA